jgi:hypothetical protein
MKKNFNFCQGEMTFNRLESLKDFIFESFGSLAKKELFAYQATKGMQARVMRVYSL